MTMHVLTVEDIFTLPTIAGIIVVPGPLEADWKLPPRQAVELRKPDGSRSYATMVLKVTFQSPPPREYRLACILEGLEKADVPIGTEVWLRDHAA